MVATCGAGRTVAGVELEPVASSHLDAVGYDPVERRLRIRFRDGTTADYLAVPRRVFVGLVASQPHSWAQWGQHIEASYDARRVG